MTSARDAVPVNEMEEIDRWMVSRLQGLVKRVTSLMDRYLLHQAVQALHLFCTVDLSSLYLDILKDRLYTFPAESRERRSAQTALVEDIRVRHRDGSAGALTYRRRGVALARPPNHGRRRACTSLTGRSPTKRSLTRSSKRSGEGFLRSGNWYTRSSRKPGSRKG